MLCDKKCKLEDDRIGRCLGYLHAEADPDRSFPNPTGEGQCGIEQVLKVISEERVAKAPLIL